tara:strand:- start:72551 stop:72787 length:237 start_codon:yes stop_codon:yes gene_type:complete
MHPAPECTVKVVFGCILCLWVSVWLRAPAIAFFPADLLKFMMDLSNQGNVNGVPAIILPVVGAVEVHAKISERKSVPS